MLIENVLGKNGIIANKLDSYELRPQQMDMALTIEKSIEENKHLIIEAGTGVGKSVAYLIPFIFWTVKNRKKVIISTHTKTLQEQLINKDLPFLRNALKSAKDNTRQNDFPGQEDTFDFSYILCVGGQNYLCLRRFNQLQMHGLFDTKKEIKELQKIIQWEEHTRNGLRSGLDFEPSQAVWSKVCRESDLCFGTKCLFNEDCYYYKARRREYKAQILVTNHHLFFANLVNEGRVLPDFDAVVFDEAQTLEDVATSYFGIAISNFKVRSLLDSILNPKTGKGLITRLFKPSDKTVANIRKTLDEARLAGDLFFSEITEKYGTGGKTTRIREKGVINNYLNKPLSNLSGTLESLLNLVTAEEERLEIFAFASRCSEIKKNISTIINQDLEEYVYWAEVEKITNSLELSNHKYTSLRAGTHRQARCSLFAAPINIAEDFEKHIFDKIRHVILTSATLSINGNFNYIKERLGIPACTSARHFHREEFDSDITNGGDFLEKIIGSPFNFSENALIYIPDNIPDPNQEPDAYRHNITKHIKEIISLTQGRS
ncbi:MAG: ATP-dependent DNA helicase, partial [Candidatus Scalindua sp.]